MDCLRPAPDAVTPASAQDLGLRDQATAVAEGRLTCAGLVQAARERRDHVNARLNAVCATFEGDLDGELEADEGGPLYGVPVAVKDAIALPWRAPHDGTPVPSPAIPAGESGVARRLRRAGAVAVMATSMHQLGLGTTGHLSADGPTLNPWDGSRCAGGSSGGSAAAVAARIVAGAVGTDAGGSVRVPASYCGVVGLKPTWGAVPMDGCTGWYSSVGVIGPIARTVGDCRALAEALLGRELRASVPEPLRIALPKPFWDDVAPAVDSACRAAIRRLEAAGVQVEHRDLPGARHVAGATMVATGTERIPQLTRPWVETVFPTLHPTVRGILKSRVGFSASSVQRTLRLRTFLRDRVADEFERSDLLAWPTVPASPPDVSRPRVTLPSGPMPADLANLRTVGLANLTGIPAITVPCGRDPDGLPVGLTLHAAWGRETLLLAAAEWLEELLEEVWE